MRLSKAELKYLRSLKLKKFREAEQKFLVEGWRSVNELISSDFKIDFVAISSRYTQDDDDKPILRQIKDRKVKIKDIPESELQQISETVHSQGIVGLAGQKFVDIDEIVSRNPTCVVVAEAVSDPGNLGSILRSCDWFGVDGLILSKGSVDLYNEKVVRSTAGSIFHVPVASNVPLEEALVKLRMKGFFLAATGMEGETLYTELRPAAKIAVILGNEAHGITNQVRQASDTVIRIPKFGKAESLNVGVACGIILAQLKNNAFPEARH